MNHQTKTLRNPFTDEDVEIDNDIVTLITHLWAEGIETSFSCQGGFELVNGLSPLIEKEIYINGYVSLPHKDFSQSGHRAAGIVREHAHLTYIEHHYVAPYTDVVRFVLPKDQERWLEYVHTQRDFIMSDLANCPDGDF